jgi:hypothetical protein
MKGLLVFALLVSFALLTPELGSATCTATATYNCYARRGALTCSGSTTCTSGDTWVMCDNVRTDCPFCEVEFDCSFMCPQGQSASIYCSSQVGRCTFGFKRVQCDSDPTIFCSSATCF